MAAANSASGKKPVVAANEKEATAAANEKEAAAAVNNKTMAAAANEKEVTAAANGNKAAPPLEQVDVAELSAPAALELFEHAIASEAHLERAVACLERCDEIWTDDFDAGLPHARALAGARMADFQRHARGRNCVLNVAHGASGALPARGL